MWSAGQSWRGKPRQYTGGLSTAFLWTSGTGTKATHTSHPIKVYYNSTTTGLGMTSFTPFRKILIRYTPNSARSPPTVCSNCSERAYLQSAFLRSVMIFVKYREVSTHTILPNFIVNYRDSVVFAFWRPQRRHR